MRCICTNCGRLHESHELVHDLSDGVKKFVVPYIFASRREQKGRFESVVNNLMKLPFGPFCFSESELLANYRPYESNASKARAKIRISKDYFYASLNHTILRVGEAVRNEVGISENVFRLRLIDESECARKIIEEIIAFSKEIPIADVYKPEYAFANAMKGQGQAIGAPVNGEVQKIFENEVAKNILSVLDDYINMPDVIFEKDVEFIHGKGDVLIQQIKLSAATEDDSVSEARRCPGCGALASTLSGAYPETVIGVLGSPRVSKTTTLSANIHFLRLVTDQFNKGNHGAIPIRMYPPSRSGKRDVPNGDEPWRIFEEKFLKDYTNGRSIEATKTAGADSIPKFSIEIVFGKGEREKHMIFTLVDIPGEFSGNEGFTSESRMKYRKIFENVNCFWYCTDPAEILQQRVNKSNQNDLIDAGYDEGRDPVQLEQLLANMNTLKTELMSPGTPVMLVMGKSDLIQDEALEDYQVFASSGNGMTNDSYLSQFSGWVNGSVSGYPYVDGNLMYRKMDKWKDYLTMMTRSCNFIDEFENIFENRAYCIMSAYGRKPLPKDVKDQTLEIMPYMGGFPIIWLLVIMDYIEIKDKYIENRSILGLRIAQEEKEVIGKFSDVEHGNARNKDNMFMHNKSYKEYTP